MSQLRPEFWAPRAASRFRRTVPQAVVQAGDVGIGPVRIEEHTRPKSDNRVRRGICDALFERASDPRSIIKPNIDAEPRERCDVLAAARAVLELTQEPPGLLGPPCTGKCRPQYPQ